MIWLLLPISYLVGSISGSLLLGRIVGVDIRTRGSGNAGGTNALRTLGWRFALGVVVIDVGKGALAAALGDCAAGTPGAAATVAFACLGHVWPLFHGFRGGKGAATLVGGLAVFWPLALLPVLLTWALVLIGSGYVGLSTIVAAATLPLFALSQDAAPALTLFSIAAAGFMLFTHRSNVQRLRRGDEHRFERARLLHRWLGRP